MESVRFSAVGEVMGEGTSHRAVIRGPSCQMSS